MQFVWSSSSPRGGVLFIIALHSQGVSGKRGTKDEEVATKVRKEYRIYKSKANRTVAAGPSRRWRGRAAQGGAPARRPPLEWRREEG